MAAEEQARLRSLISLLLEDGYTLDDIYNLDETSFYWASCPDRGLARQARPGMKQTKKRLTLALTVNATGSHRLDPLFCGAF